MAATPQSRAPFSIVCLSPSCSLLLVYRVLLCVCFPYMLWFARDKMAQIYREAASECDTRSPDDSRT